MKFSKIEIRDLLLAWILISTAFAILFSDGTNIFSNLFFISFIVSMVTAGIAFLFHELMHKSFAIKYGLWAEFRASYGMLFLAILFSFFGFIIAAPGGVYLKGRLTKEKNGKISLAGPMTNIVLAILFLIPLIFLNLDGIFLLISSYGLIINSLLAAFNLLPFMPFDGKKVYDWNKPIYIISLIISITLLVLGFTLK